MSPPTFPERLLHVAEQLARPVLLLYFEGTGAPSAAWGGTPSVPLPAHLVVTDGDELEDRSLYAHVISVDASVLPHALPGCLSIYHHQGDDRYLVLHEPSAVLYADEGRALYGQATRMRPHLDALFRHSPLDVQQWIAGEVQLPVEELQRVSELPQPTGSVVQDLDQALRADHPMWSEEPPAAQVGGWCWGWPDEAWDERENRAQQLMLVTYEDSEPWVELWWTGDHFEVSAHTT